MGSSIHLPEGLSCLQQMYIALVIAADTGGAVNTDRLADRYAGTAGLDTVKT